MRRTAWRWTVAAVALGFAAFLVSVYLLPEDKRSSVRYLIGLAAAVAVGVVGFLSNLRTLFKAADRPPSEPGPPRSGQRVGIEATNLTAGQSIDIQYGDRYAVPAGEPQPRTGPEPPTTIRDWEDLEMILIPKGEFRMGTEQGKPNEAPVRAVRLSSYYVAKFPITNLQYREFVQETGHRPPSSWGEGRLSESRQPVVHVSWKDAVAFCQWLSGNTRHTYRLPTEAEWERAARGIDGRTYPWGEQEPDAARCNFGKHTDRPTPEGKYPSGKSPCGCLDMAGNVWEWCLDRYGPYEPGPHADPKGPYSGSHYVLRGGSWLSNPTTCRCANRHRLPADSTRENDGFRVVRET